MGVVNSLPTLAQFSATAENNLTDAISAKDNHFIKLSNLAVRLPGLADGMLEGDDVLKDQLDRISEVDAGVPGETEFGHTIPITGNEMILGPYAANITITVRTRVANSNPGTVTSTPKSVVTI